MSLRIALAIALCLVGLQSAAAAAAAAGEPLAMSGEAFGRRVTVVVADLERRDAAPALRQALAEVGKIEALVDPDGDAPGGLGALNAASGGGVVALEPALLELLERTQSFCLWSDGASGPLAGHLYRLWGLRAPVAAAPPPQEIASAVASAACDRLRLSPETGNAQLAEGSRADLWPFAAGFAADRAVAALREAGSSNGFAEVAGVYRGFGPGPDGNGWRVALPAFRGQIEPLGDVWLHDQSLALAARDDGPLVVAREALPPYLDLRQGRPAEGVVAVLAVSRLGVDAQGLASTMFVTGSRSGQLRLGSLIPRPSVLWLLGSGEGIPLIVDYRWSELSR